MTVTSTIDTLPDDDSFLPRYLTVQLLDILAKTIPTRAMDMEIIKQQEKFINSFKAKELFSPLTYGIFWREDVEKILQQQTRETIDTTDKYNRAALTIAIANEDFVLARRLLSMGATLLLEDKLVLEIALISMIQRDPNFIRQILSAGDAAELAWVGEYLEYLQSYIEGHPKKTELHYHEVLNPPIRQFGQLLDTLAYFNGLPSHYGFLSPSIEILTAHLEAYTQSLLDQNAKPLFSSITNAYKTSKDICQFYGNLPTQDNAAERLAKQKDVMVLFGGWAGNSVAVAIVKNTLILSNLGTGGNPDAGTKIFNITHPEAITAQSINSLICGLGKAISPSEFLATIGSMVDPTPIAVLKQTFNPIDNCIFVNPRAIVQGLLLVLSAYNRDNKATADNLKGLMGYVSEAYNSYINSLYQYSSADLAKFMRNKELLQNRRIECCALAIDYINQHYKDPNALARCIELKNALEFVGLKDFYLSSIEPEAREQIQELMIHQQEAIAMQVIDQENTIAANRQQ